MRSRGIALDRGGWSMPHPSPGSDECENLAHTRTVQPLASCYTDYAIPPTEGEGDEFIDARWLRWPSG